VNTPGNLASPRWSRADIDTLVDLYGTVTNAELASRLESDRTPTAVYHKAQTIGLTGGRAHYRLHPEHMRRRCLILAMRDMSLAEIAAELGTGKLWVGRVIRAHPYYYRRWKAGESERRGRRISEGKRRAAA
jgi:hypothetical protein